MLIIKRYHNRRLYDTRLKRQVTLEHVVQLLRDDVTFRVEDQGSAHDVTPQVIVRVVARLLQRPQYRTMALALSKTLLNGPDPRNRRVKR
jgi:polyhydroxyalkanoate synthesis repressor PhaR